MCTDKYVGVDRAGTQAARIIHTALPWLWRVDVGGVKFSLADLSGSKVEICEPAHMFGRCPPPLKTSDPGNRFIIRASIFDGYQI